MYVGRHAWVYMYVCMSINTILEIQIYVYAHLCMDAYIYECKYLQI